MLLETWSNQILGKGSLEFGSRISLPFELSAEKSFFTNEQVKLMFPSDE
jgi:hypothetical protein